MYNVRPDYTMMQVQIATWQQPKQQRNGYQSMQMIRTAMLPRLMWLNTASTLKSVHHEVFKHIRFVFAEWADYSDESSAKPQNSNLRRIIKFPLTEGEGDDAKSLTKAQFLALSDEEAFNRLFKGVIEGQCDNQTQAGPNFELDTMPY